LLEVNGQIVELDGAAAGCGILSPVREGDDALPQPRWSSDHGYQVANWTHSGMTYWAISDVDPAELTRLTNLLGAK